MLTADIVLSQMAQVKAEGRAPLALLSGSNGAQKGRPAAGGHAVAVQASAAVAAPPDVPVVPAPAGPPKNVFVFIEPSPFSHVSGMKIRFSNLIKGLREVGDDVTVVTPCINPPRTFHGAKARPASARASHMGDCCLASWCPTSAGEL